MMERKAVFLSSPKVWERGHGRTHPLKPERLQRTFDLLQSYGAFKSPEVHVVGPEPATEDELGLFHTPEYIRVVKTLSEGGRGVPLGRYGFGPGDNPVFLGMFETERLKVGGSLKGAKMLLEGECDVAFSYSGGLHHAGPDFASGFCVFNDAAVAIHWLMERGLRVAYVDIDVHHGDGVQWAFYDTDQVLTISFHQDGRTLYPGTGFINEIGRGEGEGYSVNVPLPSGTGNEIYLWAFQEVVPILLERFEPELVVTQLGVDTHYKDPLAQLALTTQGQEALFKYLRELSPRWLALGGGGYAMDVVPRAWTLAFGVMSGQAFSDELPNSYRQKHGGRRLHDRDPAPIHVDLEDRIRTIVKQTVSAIKNLHDIE
jgi:acetoin utilization protein AcuC